MNAKKYQSCLKEDEGKWVMKAEGKLAIRKKCTHLAEHISGGKSHRLFGGPW